MRYSEELVGISKDVSGFVGACKNSSNRPFDLKRISIPYLFIATRYLYKFFNEVSQT